MLSTTQEEKRRGRGLVYVQIRQLEGRRRASQLPTPPHMVPAGRPACSSLWVRMSGLHNGSFSRMRISRVVRIWQGHGVVQQCDGPHCCLCAPPPAHTRVVLSLPPSSGFGARDGDPSSDSPRSSYRSQLHPASRWLHRMPGRSFHPGSMPLG